METLALTGWVFDLIPAGPGMEVWFRTEAGATVTLRAPFRPSFSVAGRGLREPSLRAAAASREGLVRHLARIADPLLLLRREGEELRWSLRSARKTSAGGS